MKTNKKDKLKLSICIAITTICLIIYMILNERGLTTEPAVVNWYELLLNLGANIPVYFIVYYIGKFTNAKNNESKQDK